MSLVHFLGQSKTELYCQQNGVLGLILDNGNCHFVPLFDYELLLTKPSIQKVLNLGIILKEILTF